MRTRRTNPAPLLVLALGACVSSTAPIEVTGGRYLYSWRAAPGTFLEPPALSSDGIAHIGTAPMTVIFEVPGYDGFLLPVAWTGEDWQMRVNITGTDSTSGKPYTYVLVLDWVPGGTCDGTLTTNAVQAWPGKCTFTYAPT